MLVIAGWFPEFGALLGFTLRVQQSRWSPVTLVAHPKGRLQVQIQIYLSTHNLEATVSVSKKLKSLPLK